MKRRNIVTKFQQQNVENNENDKKTTKKNQSSTKVCVSNFLHNKLFCERNIKIKISYFLLEIYYVLCAILFIR